MNIKGGTLLFPSLLDIPCSIFDIHLPNNLHVNTISG